MSFIKSTARGLKDSRFGRAYIGDKAFYITVISIIVPVVIQNSISNFVNLLDNIMVGAVSTEQMSGVSIGNQLIFVFSLCVFGGVSGATIFSAQFHGAGDVNGVRNTFRYALIAVSALTLTALGVFILFGDKLLMLYINDSEQLLKVEDTFEAGKAYLGCMLIGLFPFAISQAYAGTLRSTGEQRLPMIASIASVFTNLVLNYVLIFGHLGFPPLKARGAAIATVIARFVEMGIIVSVTHISARRRGSYPFINGVFRRFSVPVKLVKRIIVKGMPLLANEAFWALGMATLAQQYSLRGVHVVAASNITSTLTNLFNVFFLSMGTATAVMIGQTLGANDTVKARTHARQIIALQIAVCFGMGLILFIAAPYLPYLFTSAETDVRNLATSLIRVCACTMPVSGIAHCCYFIMRSGGRTGITFLFDSVYTWLLPVPLVMALVNLTGMDIVYIYILCHATEIFKVAIGFTLVKKGVWIRNIVT